MQLNIVFRDWLKSRRISDEVLHDFGIYGQNEIVIPVHEHDRGFIFNKYRRSPLSDDKPKYWYDRGGKVTLYGWWRAKEERTILITEGEMDCLVAWSQNIPAVTSTGGAMSFQEEWKDLLSGKDVVIAFDNDGAGAEGMVKVLKYLPDAKVLLLPDRANMKDISDYVAGGGDLRALIRSAKRYGDISEVREDMINRVASFQSVHFHQAYIKEHTRKAPVHVDRQTFSNDRVTNAKSYPMENLMEFKQGKACCPFHNEKTPSFKYYPKDNHAYCFGCGKVADSISVYMLKHGVSFTEAVTRLNEMV